MSPERDMAFAKILLRNVHCMRRSCEEKNMFQTKQPRALSLLTIFSNKKIDNEQQNKFFDSRCNQLEKIYGILSRRIVDKHKALRIQKYNRKNIGAKH